ncbi:uncharacterized protein [Dermacentor andersoni]|uniref:uncharacterized protein n=1 Tax=Dermacentor andersoni TaxID=34620 RepID=UPI0024168C62|nr:uncharacterized protein LOC129384430 [Dermacentor andersoni]
MRGKPHHPRTRRRTRNAPRSTSSPSTQTAETASLLSAVLSLSRPKTRNQSDSRRPRTAAEPQCHDRCLPSTARWSFPNRLCLPLESWLLPRMRFRLRPLLVLLKHLNLQTVILPMIGSAVIICLMLAVIIGMLVSNRRRARVTGTNATRPTTVISDDVEVTATSATTTSVTTPSATTTGTTGTENTTISHSQGVVVEQTEPVSWDTATFLVVP